MPRKKAAVNSPTPTGWSENVGAKGKNLVTVYERLDKKRMVYLRWSSATRLHRESLGILLPWTEGPDAVTLAQHRCREHALRKSADIVGIRDEPAAAPEAVVAPFPEAPAHPSAIPLRVGLERVHEATYLGIRRDSQHAKEQLQRIEELCAAFPNNTWENIPAEPLEAFVTNRAEHYLQVLADNHGVLVRGAGGLRQTQKGLSFLFQASRRLAVQERALSPIVPPPKWLDTVENSWYAHVGHGRLKIPATSFRYKMHERDALIAALNEPGIDPRIRVAVTMGSGSYRLGQVMRMLRSHVELSPDDGEHGRMTIVSSGHKKGGGYLLTPKESRAWHFALDGYLREFVARFPDPNATFPLFPAGIIGGGAIAAVDHAKPLDIKTMNELWHQYEEVAGVPRMAGRAWYGLRRANADAVLPAAARLGYARGAPLDERAVLLVTNHAFRMQQHYRAKKNSAVDRDNLLLRLELEKPQAEYVPDDAPPELLPKRDINRHPNRHPTGRKTQRP